MGLALGGAGGFGGEGGGLLQRGAEFERRGDPEGVALAAADGPAGGERGADGLVTAREQVVGEQTGKVEGDHRVRLRQLLGGRSREDVELHGEFASSGGVQDTADRLRVDLVLPSEGLDGGAFAERLDHLRCLVLVERGGAAERLAGGFGGGNAFAGVLREHVALELQHGGEHVHHHLGAEIVGGEVDYYDNEARGNVPQYKNELDVSSWTNWLAFDALSQAPNVTTPTIVVHSDESALPDSSKAIYEAVQGERELVWSDGNHYGYYDSPQQIDNAVANVSRFFRTHLTQGQAA